jgi:hypothetical protein
MIRKYMSVALCASVLAGCGAPNIYDMTPDEAYKKLYALKKGTAFDDDSSDRRDILGTPGKSVTWTTDTGHAYFRCTAYLTAEGATQTSANIGCDRKNAPAKYRIFDAVKDEIAPDVPDMHGLGRARHRYIELVDSTLEGREFDQERSKWGVWGWPAPPVEEGK